MKMLVSCRTSRRWSATRGKSEGRKEVEFVHGRASFLTLLDYTSCILCYPYTIATIFVGCNCCDFGLRCCDFVLESKRLDFWRKKAMNMDFGA